MKPCPCYGCWFSGQGACGCLHCDACDDDFDEALECVDEEANRHECNACIASRPDEPVGVPAFWHGRHA